MVRDVMLADLEALVGVESPSRQIPAITASAEAVNDLLQRVTGRRGELIDGPNGPHVWWRGDGQPKVLIVGHHDTVFPLGTLAARPFAVADGRATGPGVFDMKAGIVLAVHAVAALGDLARHVEMIFSSDEEVGSVTSRDLIVERATACGTALVFEPAGDDGALKIARKGMGTFEVVVRGRAAHAGLEPEKGVNSLIAAAELVRRIAEFGDAALGTTVTPTMAHSGTADNVVPALTTMFVDARVTTEHEKDRVETAMRGLSSDVPGAQVEVRGGINRPPMPAEASAALLPAARAAAQAAGVEVAMISVGGGSDGNFTAAAGVPTLDGLGAVGGGAHADHEFVVVDALEPRARFVTALLGELLAGG